MITLILSQLLGLVWNTSTFTFTDRNGAPPSKGLARIAGFNDEPYADRAMVCMPEGRTFAATQLTKVLADKRLAPVVDTAGLTINAMRMVKRTNEMTLVPAVASVFARTCDQIDRTLDAIQNGCAALGFNVTRDVLRIVEGVAGTTTQAIPRALPVLIMPFWDNAIFAAYMIPSWDGSLCVFNLNGVYQTASLSYAVLKGTPKTVRANRLAEWLHSPDGQWRNGWYETADSQRWYTSMVTSYESINPYGLESKAYDTLANEVFSCPISTPTGRCVASASIQTWGSQLTTTIELRDVSQAFATNGSRYGVFLYEATTITTTKLVYSLAMFISNIADLVILLRWFVSMAAMLYSYVQGIAALDTSGIGYISSSRTFNSLPFTMLPKLKLTLCAFFTVGCAFEGRQQAFATAWYLIYPAIIEFMLLFYSLLNAIGKLTYRRISDVLFGPTLIFFCALHYFRFEIARARWFGINQRVSTVMMPSEVDALTLLDLFTTDAAIKLNGNIKPLFYLKLAVLAVNLVPLLLSENMTRRRGEKAKKFLPCEIERLLAVRAANIGGLGRSHVYENRQQVSATIRASASARLLSFNKMRSQQKAIAPRPLGGAGTAESVKPNAKAITETWAANEVRPIGPELPPTDHVLIGYELNRLGYLVFGGKFLVSYDDWYILTSLAPLRVIENLWNYRLVVIDVARNEDGTYRVVGPSHLCRVDDPKLRRIPFYQVTVCAFQ